MNDLRRRISERAYDIWQRRGEPDGHDVDHWLQAELEVTAAALAAVERQNSATAPSQAPEPAQDTARRTKRSTAPDAGAKPPKPPKASAEAKAKKPKGADSPAKKK